MAGSQSQPGFPVVSVVIPSHNRARFLSETLDTVFAQRDCPPFEVIVVDDASTDDTEAVVRSYQNPVEFIRLASNRGVATARQTGAARARGDLLAFHDSDDGMLPGRIGALATYLQAHPAVGAVFANGEVERPDGTVAGCVVPHELAARLDGRPFSVREILRNQVPVYLQASLIRRSVFEAVDGIDTSLDRHADLDLACRLTLVAPVVFHDRPVFRYRLHGTNQTRDRLRLRAGLVVVMRRLRARYPDALAAVGPEWFRRREARHLYRIARARHRAGDAGRARAAIVEALALEPWSLRYRWLSWRI